MASMSSERWDCTMEDMDLERIDVPEIDDALLMELLEETHANDAEDERLGHVMQSLQAAIDPAGPTVVGDSESVTNPLDTEDVPSDLDSHDDSVPATCIADDPFCWMGMEAAPEPAMGYGMGGWCMEEGLGEDGIAGYGEPRDFGGYYCGEYCSIEQVFSPLWQ